MTLQLQTVSSRGEMGTFYNLHTHSLDRAFADGVGLLLKYLGMYSVNIPTNITLFILKYIEGGVTVLSSCVC